MVQAGDSGANGTIVRAAAVIAVSWANGGGITRVIAERRGAFRLSLATLADDGPFSPFPGLVRHFALVAGQVGLSGSEAPFPVELDAASAPIVFPGNRAVHAAIAGAPALALNLMVPVDAPPLRLERCNDGVVRDGLAVFACDDVAVDQAPGRVLLAPHDTLFPAGPFRVTGRALVVRRCG